MIEQALIQRCLNEDRKAYELLYNQSLPVIVGLCRRYQLPNADMEDMIQEIYSEMFTSLHKYDERKGAFIAWFKKIGLHKILKGFRKKNVKIVSIEPFEHQLQDDSIVDEDFSEKEILELVDKLPMGYKTIFNLSRDGLDHTEISNYLGISKSTSRSQLARAKQLLRNQITSLNFTAL